MDDEESRIILRALRMVLNRHGITLETPWRDFPSFRTHWIAQGAYNSWQARRELLAGYFDVLAVCAVGGVIIGAIAGLTDGGSIENMFIGAVYAGVIGLFLPGLPAALIAAGVTAARGRRRA